MKERKLFQEVPGRRNDFHSAVLTSYSFNFHHFEFQVLRTLRQKWITNISVLVDQHMLDGSIGLASGNLKQLSQSYSVNGIRSLGAFHPKMNFLIGDDRLLLFFGSGNITPGGHGKNHELFTSFYADTKDSLQLPILLEAWEYLRGLTQDIAGYNKERITKQIVTNSSFLIEKGGSKHTFYPLEEDIEVALLYNEATSIFSQLVDLIPTEMITRISIICPFYDEDGASILSLASRYDKAILDIYLPAEFGLPPVNIQNNKRINFYAWENTKRGKEELSGEKSTYVRKLHSKIFHFESDGHEYLMLGSANATRAGLGTQEQRGANDEFCALYKSPNIDFLGELGIRGKKKINVRELDRPSFVMGDEGKTPNVYHKVFIKGVDLRSQSLSIYLKNILQDTDYVLVVYNSLGEEVHQVTLDNYADAEFILSLSSEVIQKELSYIKIADTEGNSVSNKQLINHLERLFHTDPSKANRSINQVINGLETGSINEFEILAYLNDINHVREVNQTKQTRLGAREEKEDDSLVIEITYDEAVEASKNPLQRQKIIRTHNSVRLWESISRLLLDNIQRRNDELEDEEEDASAEKSNIRKSAPPPPPHPKGIKVEQLIRQVERLVKKYKSSLTHVTNMADHQIDVIDYAQFLLVTHIVTALTYYNDGEAFKKEKKEEKEEKVEKEGKEQKKLKNEQEEDNYDPNWQLKLDDTFKYQMKEILTSFNRLLIRQNLQESEDSNDQFTIEKLSDYKTKTIYNSLLYLHLIDSLSPASSFMRNEIELIAFNLFQRLGLSDLHFEQYMDDISRTEDEVLFNVSAVIHLKDTLEMKYFELDNNDKYFRIDHSGWCIVKEKYEHKVRYESVYGIRTIPTTKYKKYKNLGPH